MVRLDRKLQTIRLSPKQLKEMAAFAAAHEVLALYLYGSYGTEYQTPLSDVALAVLPMPRIALEVERLLNMEAELSLIAGCHDISLINLRRVPVTLQMRVLEDRRPLYIREELFVAAFVELVIRRYCDFEPDLRAIQRDYDEGLREEFLDDSQEETPNPHIQSPGNTPPTTTAL
jgi:predicted nucleotidyltransferase